MAIYEYYCPTCRNTFERLRPMSEATVATQCGSGHRAERTISNFAVTASEDGGNVAQMDPGFAASGGCACGGGGCGCSN
ncbi:MAG: FmdB family transcriptional regulator [Dehalococcoidia bacterium]|nr:FmdB family transcriptional regulator [Dehalococcoidia bacterium]HCV00181.1 FmdB family transcriptional regulator [Dehalococcoidia bacterium]